MDKDTIGILATLKEIFGAVKTVGGIILVVVHLPQTISRIITEFFQSLLPGFLQWEIGSKYALVIAIICTALAAKYWSKAVGGISGIVKLIPFLGGLLSLAVIIVMYVGLYYGIHAVAASGWLQALALLGITLAICAPGYWKWIVLFLTKGGRIGAWIAKHVFRGARYMGRAGVAGVRRLSDPVEKAVKETMEQLLHECGEDATQFLTRADHIGKLLIEKHPESRKTITAVIQQFAVQHGIMTIKSRPIGAVVEADFTF